MRFGLTSESSLNDGLAFPFTNLAILLAVYGFAPSEWAVRWLLIDVGYKIVGGVVIGWAVGEVLGWLTLKLVGGKGFAGMFDTGEGLAPSVMALAYTLISFGLCEVAGAYGFIAVFVTAYVVRDSERQNHVHDHLHEGAEQLELLAMSIVLLLLGAAFADGLYQAVTWEMVAAALLLVLVARPVAGWIGLLGHGGATHPGAPAAVVLRHPWPRIDLLPRLRPEPGGVHPGGSDVGPVLRDDLRLTADPRPHSPTRGRLVGAPAGC